MRRHSLGSIFIVLLMFCSTSTISSAVESTLTIRPSNYESYKSKINDSLVGVSCANENSVGFSAKWTVTEEDKNNGINSQIFTTGQSLFKCGRVGASAAFDYKGKSYSGKIWNSSGSMPDFGGFSASVVIPQLPLWGNDAPIEKSWVGVVRYAPGFGYIWSESTVRAYNPETLIFAIDPVLPAVDRNAMVFNNRGVFIGVVSKQAVKQVEGLVTVHGAPLQCPLNQYQTSPSVTNCQNGVFAQTIWKKSANQNTTQVCVTGISGSGFEEKFTLAEQCTESKTWEFTFCDTSHPKVDLQVKQKGKWRTVKTFKARRDKSCNEGKGNYFTLTNSTTVSSRAKLYGNNKFVTSYINLKITSK
jgi:hypothetical protein